MRDPMSEETQKSDGDRQVAAPDPGAVDQPASSVVELNLDLPIVEWYLDLDTAKSPWSAQSCNSGCGGGGDSGGGGGDGGSIEA